MPVETRTRWWRRARDLAQADVCSGHALAADALLILDAMQANVAALVTAHRDRVSRHSKAGAPETDRLVGHWHETADLCATAVETFLDANGRYNATEDLDEGPARALASDFTRASVLLTDAAAGLAAFLLLHVVALDQARELVHAAPLRFRTAVDALASAQQSVLGVFQQGLLDATLSSALLDAVSLADAARADLAADRWTAACRSADQVRHAAAAIEVRAAGLPAAAQAARHGALALRTRQEALTNQHAGLPAVMSELRRNFRYSAWEHVDKAPQRAALALVAVENGLVRLAVLLAADPMDVPATTALLRTVRADAAQVGVTVTQAREVLVALTAVSRDPLTLIRRVRRAAADARRFVNGLPVSLHNRYSPTFDALSLRVDRLELALAESRPEVGAALAEAAAIERGLVAMIATARSEM